MTEGAVQTTENTTIEPALTQEQLAFKQQMDFQFNSDAPPPQVFNQQQEEQNTVAATETNNATQETPDYTPFIKEFGVETVDEFKSQWQQLQDLKANPPQPEPIKFEDEFNEKLFKAIQGGKSKEVRQYLEQQEKIETLTTAEVTDEIADEIIKLGLHFENLDLTQKEIDFTFKKKFSIPKEPVQTVAEDDDDFAVRLNEWKEQVEDIKMSKTIEAKMMKPKLEAAKSKIQFPDIAPQNIDEDYESYKASKSQDFEQVNNEVIPAIKALKETDVQFGFKVSDPKNQMEFDVTLAPTQEAFEKARQNSLSFDKWFHSIAYDDNGKFQPQNIQKLILLYDEHGNYDQSIARQAVNAERARVVGKETIGNQNVNKDYNTNIEKTELQKQMERALS